MTHWQLLMKFVYQIRLFAMEKDISWKNTHANRVVVHVAM